MDMQSSEVDQDNWSPPDIARFKPSAYIGDSPEQRYLIEGRFPKNSAVLLAGEGGVGKSFFALMLQESISSGENFIGEVAPSCKNLPCVGIYAEDTREAIDRRLKSIRLATNFKPIDSGIILPTLDVKSPMTLFKRNYAGDVEITEAFTWLDEYLGVLVTLNGGVGCVILDNLGTLASIDSNDGSQVAFVWFHLNSLAVRHDTCVILVHHLKKGGGSANNSSDMRLAIKGSATLVDGARAAYVLSQVSKAEADSIRGKDNPDDSIEFIRLVLVKTNSAMNKSPITFKRDATGVLTTLEGIIPDNDRESLIATILQHAKQGLIVTKTGKNGLFNNKTSWWPPVLYAMSRAKLEILINDTISDGGIEKLPSGGLLVN